MWVLENVNSFIKNARIEIRALTNQKINVY
jgi:hypothetical protein